MGQISMDKLLIVWHLTPKLSQRHIKHCENILEGVLAIASPITLHKFATVLSEIMKPRDFFWIFTFLWFWSIITVVNHHILYLVESIISYSFHFWPHLRDRGGAETLMIEAHATWLYLWQTVYNVVISHFQALKYWCTTLYEVYLFYSRFVAT